MEISRSNPRLDKFIENQSHVILGKLYKKLKIDDFKFCEKFLEETAHLESNEYAFTVNRLFIDGKNKGINGKDVWAILTNCVVLPDRRTGR